MKEIKIKKEVQEFYLITGTDGRSLTLNHTEKRKLGTIRKNGYFKWYMPSMQDIKESHPSPGYWAKSNVVKIEKVIKTIYVETEEL